MPLKIGIIGAGISGMCAGIQLQEQLGIHDYTIFDENSEVGGTWLVNTYPGCASDVPCHLYSFSFNPNPNWTESFASQSEILEYLKSTARKYDLYPKIQFNQQVLKTTWNEGETKWVVQVLNKITKETKEEIFDILIMGVGGLRVPNEPPEFDNFLGPKFHTATWDHTISLKDKRVAVIGTGASAVQIIPKIVDEVESLMVYQRNPPWVVPRLQFEFPSWLQWTFVNIPGIHWLFRVFLFWFFEFSGMIYNKGSTLSKFARKLGKTYLSREFKGDDYMELLPKYTIGCKRITPSDEYYASLSKSNVEIVTSKVQEVKNNSILTADNKERQIDVLILATGYRIQDYFAPMTIVVKDGVDLYTKWKKEGPQTYLGIICSQTPNSFSIIGPNSAAGYTSAIYTAECCANWTMQVIKNMIHTGAKLVKVNEADEADHMRKILRDVEGTVWSENCGSYFKDHRGVVTTINPHSALSYWRQTRKVDFTKLHFE